MIHAAAIEWTQVIAHAIDGVVLLAIAWLSYSIRRQIKTPSGKPIGQVAESAEHLSAADVALTKDVQARMINSSLNG